MNEVFDRTYGDYDLIMDTIQNAFILGMLMYLMWRRKP